MTDGQKGVLAMVSACVVWGLSGLYYGQLRHVPPLEVLSYRCLWSAVFFSLVLTVQGRIGLIGGVLRQPRQVAVVLIAAVLISTNWFGFIFAVTYGHTVEASLGYYIFPLVAVVLGRVVLGESLTRVQSGAVVLAGVGVLVLALGLGTPPWIALLLAATFGAYGLVKKRLDMGPVVSVTVEVLLLSPLALLWIGFRGTGAGGGNELWTHLLLMLSGPLTAGPLVLFAFAARRVRLSTVGLIQYVNPTLQFLVATLIFLEPFTLWHGVAFGLIWVALAVYSAAAIRQDRAARRVVSNAATSGTVEI